MNRMPKGALRQTGLALLLAGLASPALAQVPTQAGAPTDRPLPDQPGGNNAGTTTDTDLPQADVQTRSEREDAQQPPETGSVNAPGQNTTGQSQGGQMQNGQMQSGSMQNGQMQNGTMQGNAGMTGTRASGMQGSMSGQMAMAPTRAQYDAADRRGYERMVQDRLAAYDNDITGYRQRFTSASGGSRAEEAYRMIQMRRQRDQLNRRYYSLRRANDADYTQMRRQYTDDLTRYDAMMSEMGTMQNGSMNGGMQNGMNGQMQNGSMQNGGMQNGSMQNGTMQGGSTQGGQTPSTTGGQRAPGGN